MSSARPAKAKSGIEINAFSKRLGEYKNWRDDLAEIINEYQSWVESQGLANGEDDLRIYELIDALQSDKVTIAMVAEFSRGKTELINAIFFADYKQRLLPSDVGRTTMSPTELLYDEKEPPCIKLLPIDTRRTGMTIVEYKRNPIHWTTLPLDLNEPKKMAETLKEIVKTKAVNVREAEELGLYNRQATGVGPAVNSDGTVNIPVWRHAIVNYPHPLLKQGLVVLDTPGLNSLGTEPELTMGMLPDAQAVLFVLAADTGVTKSDLEVWNNHVCVAKNGKGEGRIVALNKIDALWDELRTQNAFSTMISRQMQETARALGINKSQIFPISAQKGLLGKIKTDHALIEKSGLNALEIKLSTDIVAAKQKLIREKVAREIGSIIDTTSAMIDARLSAVDSQLNELRGLSGKSQGAIQEMITRMRKEKQAYDKTMASFQATRMVLSDQIKILLDYLSTETFDELMTKTRHDMNESWSTRGLRTGMKTLFDGALEAMEKANKQTQQIRGLVQAIYNKFHQDHKLAKIKPVGFSLLPYRSQLQRLYEEADGFRNSPLMMMTEQHFVVKKFFITLASRARQIFTESGAGAKAWSKAIMAPILAQVREHKIMMDHRLENLKKVHENLGNLSGRIADIEANKQNLENQQMIIRSMLRKINQPLSLNS
ncbi:MAG: dynamin-like GTPase family protein [Gammaproteobacteria bacterium]|nr:MAG: dynamin-like GTPase family protein [Gammaproteobacteria bacterium]